MYNHDWHAPDYPNKYYTLPALSDDEQAIFRHVGPWLAGEFYQRGIEVGCGPTVHHALAVVPHVAELHLADYLESNLEEVRS